MSHHPGEVVGDTWALVTPIHVGGMGEVWRAASVEDRRAGAVKFLTGEGPAALERFEREAANLAAIESRHVPRLIGVGPGHLVMEYVEGESLAVALERRRTLPAAEVARLVGECADGLAATHVAGVLHRDVKPSNILRSPRGAVLTDFGVSHALGQEPLTDPGRVMGTAEYLAPEVITGSPASPASDVYALGVSAFEALTGAVPFRGTTPLQTAFAHVDLPVPTLPDAVPPFLRDLVTAMIAKDPADRPSALCVGAAARQLLDANTAHDGPNTLGRDAGPAGRRSQHSSEEDKW